MGVRVEGLEEFSNFIVEVEVRAKRGLGKKMRKKAEKLQALAKAMAPVEYGGIEESIKINGDGSQERGPDGRFGSVSPIEVYIDDTQPAKNGRGVSVDAYVYEIHEHLTPWGSKKLGDLSREKQAASGVVVGGGFMYRAQAQIDAELDREVENMLDGIL